MNSVQISTARAFTLLGRPYIWGGDGSDRYFGGLDCSGSAQIILDASGKDPKGDQSAIALYTAFKDKTVTTPCEGALVFYGKDVNHIGHVGYCISDDRMIEAGGGDSTCTSVAIAKAKNAEVRISRIYRRKDVVAFVYPFL